MAESFYTDGDLSGAGDNFDATGVTLGDALTFDVPGTVTHIRFRATVAQSGGTYVGALYPITASDPPGVPPSDLAQATAGAISPGDWNLVALPGGGVSVLANTPYRPAMYSSVGRYVSRSGFHSGGDITRGHITSIGNNGSAAGLTIGNGSFNYATGLSFPRSGTGAAYFVDVVFEPSGTPDPSEGAADLGLGLAVAATGSATRAGTADVGLALAVAAAGARPSQGRAAVILDLSPAGAGARTSLGAADVSLALAADARGGRTSQGLSDLGLILVPSSAGSDGSAAGVAAPRLVNRVRESVISSRPGQSRIVTRTQRAS